MLMPHHLFRGIVAFMLRNWCFIDYEALSSLEEWSNSGLNYASF